ncbi:MAG: ABC transporter permease, partial [Chloroflexota bacterium]|nr:ABC transporter permease [Chloroflexota bacterium]
MFRNYVTVALRHLSRRKGYSFINVMSLALGISCCLLIMLYIRDELSYDRYHGKADRIYRVISEERQGGAAVRSIRSAEVMTPTAR